MNQDGDTKGATAAAAAADGVMLARGMPRALRRLVLLLPLALLSGALLLLNYSPRPPQEHSKRARQGAASLAASEPTALRNQLTHGSKKADDWSGSANQDGSTSAKVRPWFMREGSRRPHHSDEPPPLFPEDDPGNDRIVEQLMYALPDGEKAPMKTILLSGTWNVQLGRAVFLENRCPVDRCSITKNMMSASTADAILFKDIVSLTLNTKRNPKQIWILYYLECPYHTSDVRPGNADVINWTATYRRDSDIVAPYERWVYYDDHLQTETKPIRNYAANKTKKVAWFVSNCHARNKRLEYAQQLAKYIDVDIFGTCGKLHCLRSDPDCLDMLDREYKFYLAFENSNCRDYITEKFFVNGLGRDILPIVMGARPAEYAAAAPHKSYIHVEEFAGPRALATYLHMLDGNDRLYNEYFKWKGKGEFINTYFFCRVCAMLHAAERRGPHRYANVQAWWSDGACTAREWRSDAASHPNQISNYS